MFWRRKKVIEVVSKRIYSKKTTRKTILCRKCLRRASVKSYFTDWRRRDLAYNSYFGKQIILEGHWSLRELKWDALTKLCKKTWTENGGTLRTTYGTFEKFHRYLAPLFALQCPFILLLNSKKRQLDFFHDCIPMTMEFGRPWKLRIFLFGCHFTEA